LAVFASGKRGGLVNDGFDAQAVRGIVGSLAGNPASGWALVTAVAAFSGVAYALTARAEKTTTPVVAAAYNSLQPVIAVLVLGALGEAPGARNLTGSFLIVAGGFAAVALSTNDLPALEAALRRRGERGGGAGGREARADRARGRRRGAPRRLGAPCRHGDQARG
jgi:hypothetical protein